MITSQALSLSYSFPRKNAFFATLQVLGASLFLALCSHISIPLYFSPVPLSGQTVAIMLIGITLGSRKGLLSVLAYLAQGSFGLPVFSAGHSGILHLVGPTGGYLLGFLFQVYLVGKITEKQQVFHSGKTFFALLLSSLVLLTFGTLWLSLFVGVSSALVMGFLPFVVGDIIKALAITTYFRKLHEKNPAL